MNFPIRLSKLACTDPDKINRFLEQARTGYLGLTDGEFPYVIPLNFVWWEGCIYIHGAAEGRKVSLIEQNPNVCFTISEEYGTLADPVPAKTDTAYMSVMIQGTITALSDLETATAAMQQMLDKYVPGYYDQPLAQSHVEKYRSSLGSRTLVYMLKPASLTAKENALDEGAKFVPGRTVQMDVKPSHLD